MANLVLGPSGGNGGHAFEDYAIPEGAKVKEIRVNAGFYVDGLQLICVDDAGTAVELPHLGGKSGFRHTITLDADEYLTGISGRSGRYIDSIRFHTNKRVTDSIGGRGGENEYHFEAAVNGEVAGFFGRADWYMDQLGVVLRDRVAAAGAAVAAAPSAAPVKPAKSTKAAAPKAEAKAPAAEAPATKAATTKAATTKAPAAKAAPAKAAPEKAAAAKAVPPKAAKTAKPEPAAVPAAAPAAKPASKSRKKTAPESELVAVPEAATMAPAAPDLVAVPDSGAVAPAAPDLVAVPASSAVDAAAPKYVGVPDSPKVESAAQADDLTKIEGIGPKIAQVLADAGITTFAALASTPAGSLRETLNAAGSRYRITDPTTWPEQAGYAARGEWDAFNDLVGRLKAGKRA